jgi:tetratricopeptide (TPR) repeat protein
MPDDPLEAAVEAWRAALTRVGDEAGAVGDAMARALAAADSTDGHDRAGAVLGELVGEAEQAVACLRELVRHVEDLRSEWIEAHRYTQESLAALALGLAAELDRDPIRGARTWLEALLDAVDAGETGAVAAIAGSRLDFPEALRDGAARLRYGFARWTGDTRAPASGPVEDLAERRLDGWDAVLTPAVESRVRVLAAWTVLRNSGDATAARHHLDEAVRVESNAARPYAARSALHLFAGHFEAAATDAQRAIELAPDEPFGYLALGVWSELTGKFAGADDLYRRALARMPPSVIARLHRRRSLVDPTGRLLLAAAAFLLEAGRPGEALALAGEAQSSGVRGREAHPEAEVHVLRRRALERLAEPQPDEAAKAGTQAGRLLIWNGDLDRAIDELSRAARHPHPGAMEAGWLLADALLTKSFPLRAGLPDQALVDRARATWDSWVDEVGLPEGRCSWAYETRAIAADLASQRPGADRRGALFEALLYVEKSLVHNHTDAQRLGRLAQYLRYLGFEQLAFEAAAAGYELAAADRQVLAERLPLLANRRAFDETEATAERLTAMYGRDPWVDAVRAWLALHHRRDGRRALDLLRLPLVEGSDRAWYYEMQALAWLLLDEPDQARRAYRRVLDVSPVDGNTKFRLARAAFVVGDEPAGQRWLAEGRDDPTAPVTGILVTEAFQALAGDDVGAAAGALGRAVGHAASPGEVDDLLFEATLAMRALDHGGVALAAERERVIRDATQEPAAERKSWLEHHPPTADAELDAALARVVADGPAVGRVALVALAARRDLAGGRRERARDRYESLRDSAFEPEATIARGRLAGP